MVADENVVQYIDFLYGDGSGFLENLRESAEGSGVPIIRRQSEGFIKSLLLLVRPENILEIGTGVAYSAIFMANVLPDCRITTIENFPPRIVLAKENIAKAGLESRISLIEEDAANALPALSGSYDLIFLDGPKGQYEHYLPELLRLVKKGGVLLCDNVLQGGDIAKSRFAIERRKRTTHERLRSFLYEITHSSELETSILTVGDGLSLSIRL